MQEGFKVSTGLCRGKTGPGAKPDSANSIYLKNRFFQIFDSWIETPGGRKDRKVLEGRKYTEHRPEEEFAIRF